MFKLSSTSLLVTAALAATSNVAQAEPDAITPVIDEIFTITATRTERSFMESPASIATVTAEDIQRSSADSIADSLRDIPGIQITDAATPGMKRITLRGESSLRVAVLVDGQEITDHSTYGAPLLLDTSMVERVEVIRGTSSVLYGGKALGGVINIITKKGGSEPIQASLSAGYSSATQGHQYAASVYGHVEGFDYRLSLADNDHKDRSTPAGDIEDTSFANDSAMLYLAKEFEDHQLGFTYEKFDLSSEIATGIPGFFLNMPQRDRSKTALFYNFDGIDDVFKKFHIDAYDQTIDRNFVQHMEMTKPLQPPMSMDMVIDTNIQERLDTKGVNTQLDLALGDQHYLILGLQYTKDELNKQTDNSTSTTINIPNMPSMPQVKDTSSIEDATLETKALYIQDEWRLTEQAIITAGARHYWVDSKLNESSREGLSPSENSDDHFIASIAANYAFNDQNNLRAVFSQGYHYPTLLQIATGATAAGSYINPNPDLKPESSDNIEIGYRLYTNNWLLDTSYFYNDASDYITSRSCQGTELACVNPERDKVYINADKAKTSGLEFSLSYAHHQAFSPYANITWLSREETYGSFTTKDTGTPSLYGKLGVKYQNEGSFFKSYYLDAYVRAATDADVAYADGAKDVYDSWHTVNLAFGTQIGDKQQYSLNVEFSNIFDEEYSPANETLLAPGRAIMVKLSADL